MNEGDEGPSVEVKEEENKDGADVKPSKEKPNAMETAADSKPPGDKYSPKVSLRIFLCCYALWYVLLCISVGEQFLYVFACAAN